MKKLSKAAGTTISPSLLWDQDMASFDWKKNRVLVVQRVIERGWPSDFVAAANMYGGEEGLREIVKEVPFLTDKDINFVCLYFNLRKEELKCYTNKLLRQARLSS